MGAVDISAGADSTRAGGSSKRRRDERETRGGNRYGPLLFPLISVILLRRCGNNFLLLSVSTCLKMGLNSVDGWEQQGNQKDIRGRNSAPIYLSSNLSQLLSWLLSIFTKSVVLVQHPFPLFMPCIPLSFPSSRAFPSPVFSHPLFLLPPCHRCLIIYEVLKNLLCNQGYQNVIHFQWNPSSVFFSSGMVSCQNDCAVWPVVHGGSLVVFMLLEIFKIQILKF